MMSTASLAAERMRSLLSQIRILRGCSAAELAELGRCARILRFERDHCIAAQGDASKSVFLVAFGRVHLAVLGENGRELIVGDVPAGGFFGDEALHGAATQRASAIALAESTVLSVPAEAFAAFLGAHPRVALEFATQLSRQLQTARESVVGLGLLTVEQRLMRVFELLAQQYGSHCPEGVRLRERPTHRELAARVGARRETVTRALDALTRRGLILARGATLLLPRVARQAA